MQPQYKNLTDLLALVPEDKKPIAKKLITELNFMTRTLTALRKEVNNTGAVVLFKNGKQEMYRENPALKSYNTTARQYAAYYKQLNDLLPKAAEAQPEGGGGIYDFIKGE